MGSGTTILAAKEKGIPAVGYDISPLSVLATKTKISYLHYDSLYSHWLFLKKNLTPPLETDFQKEAYPDLVQEALPGKFLTWLDWIKSNIRQRIFDPAEKDFFLLGLLAVLPMFSRAVATGGWLKWRDEVLTEKDLKTAFEEKIASMLHDLKESSLNGKNSEQWIAKCADARSLPNESPTFSAVITSPPYPNRHDYTRVFGVELMFAFLDKDKTRELRYQSIESHPEARPKRKNSIGYRSPQALESAIQQITLSVKDKRILRMLRGYFLDMYLCLQEMKRVCIPGARIAMIVGNAQYCGIPILVDEYVADAGEQVGLICEKIMIARYRGNSAQQMKIFGRNPSQESVVMFRCP